MWKNSNKSTSQLFLQEVGPGTFARKAWKQLRKKLPKDWQRSYHRSPWKIPSELDESHSFYRDGGKAHILIARKSSKIKGFLTLLIPPNSQTVRFSSFDVLDKETGKQLIEKGIELSHNYSAERILGPLGLSTWYPYRFLEQSKRPSFFNEPWQPENYLQIWVEAGFVPNHSYFSQEIKDPAYMVDQGQSHINKWLALGGSFEYPEAKSISGIMEELHDFTKSAFKMNYLYSDISLEEFSKLYSSISSLLWDQNLILARNPKNELVGFLLHYPDFSELCSRSSGLRSLWHQLRFILKGPKDLESRNTWIFKTVAAKPVMGRVRLGLALTSLGYQIALKAGAKRFIHALMEENNLSRSFSPPDSHDFHRYLLLERSV